MWLTKGNFKRETKSLPVAAQNNAIRTNHIKARIDKTQQNSKCSLYGDKDKTINHIISECSKLAQKEYKTRHDWVGNEIHWEVYKKFKFHHTNKWYMHSAAILENNTHINSYGTLTYVCISKSQRGLCVCHSPGSHNLGQKTRPNNNQQKKRTYKIGDFAVPVDHRIKLKES